MPSRVPSRPQGGSLISNCAVAAPVSEAVVDRWNNELAYLHSKQVQPIYSGYIVSVPLASGSMRCVYNRSPGVSVIRVDIELARGAGTGSGVTVGVTSSAGTITIIGDGSLNGTRSLDAGYLMVRSPQTFSSYFLVTGITVGTPVELIITWTDITKSNGLAYLNVVECPLADTSPVIDPTTEMGLDWSWSAAGNPIVNGTSTTPNGIIRVVSQLDGARSAIHRHWQLATPEDDTTAWPVSSAVSASVPFGTNNSDLTIRGRAPLLYTGTSHVCEARVRYRCSAANTGHVTFVVTPIGGAAVNTTIAIPNSGAWTSVTGAILLPTSGTGQEFTIAFKADTTSDFLLLDLLAVTGNES